MRERAINRILDLTNKYSKKTNKYSKKELEKKFQKMETLELIALSQDMEDLLT
tara:strand:+ start:42 stop:200 length:159 start_codon:yes stop_codon:yes gene_type:complete